MLVYTTLVGQDLVLSTTFPLYSFSTMKIFLKYHNTLTIYIAILHYCYLSQDRILYITRCVYIRFIEYHLCLNVLFNITCAYTFIYVTCTYIFGTHLEYITNCFVWCISALFSIIISGQAPKPTFRITTNPPI